MRYMFSGNERIGKALEALLSSAGFIEVGDAALADVLVSYCTSQTELEDIYFGEEGYVSVARPKTLLIDLSPSTTTFSRELASVAAVSDLRYVEAPLVFCAAEVEHALDKAYISVYMAGEEEDIAHALPFLEKLSDKVKHVGSYGTAQLARAGHTLQEAAQLVSSIEACALFQAVKTSPAGTEISLDAPVPLSRSAELCMKALNDEEYYSAYTLEMFMAELSAALMVADDADLILPQAESIMHLLELLAVIGGSDMAPVALCLIYGEEDRLNEYGLDWSRAAEVLPSDDADDLEYDVNDDADDGLGLKSGFGYSSN